MKPIKVVLKGEEDRKSNGGESDPSAMYIILYVLYLYSKYTLIKKKRKNSFAASVQPWINPLPIFPSAPHWLSVHTENSAMHVLALLGSALAWLWHHSLQPFSPSDDCLLYFK